MIKIHPEIKEALAENHPVILIESAFFAGTGKESVFTKSTALIAEKVREEGAVPAFLGIADGNLTVGMGQKEIEQIADPELMYQRGCGKVLLPYMHRNKLSGGVNNALMLYTADYCGILFTVTGMLVIEFSRKNGFDISAELYDLSQLPVMLFSSGHKPMLDPALTREVLETMGITIAGYQTDVIPPTASGEPLLPVDWRAGDPKELAEIFLIHKNAGFRSGIAVYVPASLPGNRGTETPEENAVQAVVNMFIDNAQVAAKTAVSYANERRKKS